VKQLDFGQHVKIDTEYKSLIIKPSPELKVNCVSDIIHNTC